MKLSGLVKELAEPAALLAGAAAGTILSVNAPAVIPAAGALITPLLMVVLFALFARVSLERLAEAARDRRYLLTAVGLNFVSTPLIAFALGWLFLRDWPELWVGLVLALITPCTDWYLIFTELAGGDLSRNLALLPWNLVLQLALLPAYLFLLTQRLVPVELGALGKAFALLVLIPFASAQLLRRWRPRAASSTAVGRLGLAALVLAVVAMFASHGDVFLKNAPIFLRLVPPMLSFYLIAIVVARLVSVWMGFSRERFIALACTTTARNSPLALPLAVVLFPAQPVIALSQLIEPVLEIPTLIAFSAWSKLKARRAAR